MSHEHESSRRRVAVSTTSELCQMANVASWTSGIGPGQEMVWSPECEAILGRGSSDAPSWMGFLELVPIEERARVSAVHDALLESGAPFDVEHRIVRPTGEVRWVHHKAMRVGDVEGPPSNLVGMIQDVTDRRTTLDALRRTEQAYARLLEATIQGVWALDGDAVTTFVNARLAAMLGYDAHEIVGRSVFAFVDPEQADEIRRRLEERRRGVVGHYEVRLRRRDGTYLPVLIDSAPIRGEGGVYVGVLGMITDPSASSMLERAARSAADQLQRTEARWRALIENSADIITVLEADGTITYVSPAAEDVLGYAVHELVSRSAFSFVHPEDQERVGAALEALRREGAPPMKLTYRLVHRNGSTRWVEAVATNMLANPAVCGIVGNLHDVTEHVESDEALRTAREQLVRAERLEAMGRFAAGIAHDFNNILSVILSYAELAMREVPPSDPMGADIAEIANAGRRAADLTQKLLAIGRRQIISPRVIDVGETVSAIVSMLRRLVGEDIEVAFVSPDRPARALVDPTQIEQILMNLAANARDAMPDGGRLNIEVGTVRFDEDAATRGAVAAGSYVTITVSDVGVGMDAATRERIFEPFFTTKEPGKGTGLGLASVLGLVQQSGGYIHVESERGAGTTFRIFFPRVEQGASGSIAPGTTNAEPRGSETVLVVDDDASVRTVARRILRRAGYNVLEAENAGMALLVAEREASPIHLLLTDVIMPRMNGRELAERLQRLRPGMRVLYMSGYAEGTMMRAGVVDHGVVLVPKPLTPMRLAGQVRAVLDAAA